MWFSKRPYFAKASKGRRIYLDYASAPPILPQAVRAMREVEAFVGNPGAIHAEGVAAKSSLEDSRSRIAKLLGCKARELVFTSGLTEANNLAILGYAKKLERVRRSLAGTHWIVSAIEHDSVLECFAEVERMGGVVSHVDPDERGIITPATIERALKPETVFVSVGWANNEIGVVQPLGKIARILRAHEKRHDTSLVLHTDAGQAPLYLPTVVHSLGVDLLALGGNKLYGPHGVGKTHLAVGILKEAIRSKGARGYFFETRDLLRLVRDTYNRSVDETEMSVLAPVLNADLLVLDDLGAEKSSEWVQETLGLVVNTRYNAKRATIFTSNLDDDLPNTDLRSFIYQLGARTRSRLKEMCHWVKIIGPDYRDVGIDATDREIADWEKNSPASPKNLPADARPKSMARARLKSRDSGTQYELNWSGGKAGSK